MPARGKSESLNSINKLCMVVHACDPSFCVRLLVEESLSEAGPGGGGDPKQTFSIKPYLRILRWRLEGGSRKHAS
jgi:hypothetical protein